MNTNELLFSNYTVEKTGIGYDCFGDIADIALCACAVTRGTYDGGAEFWFEYGIFVGDLNDIEDQCNVEPELLELDGIPAKEGEQVYEMFLNGTWYDDEEEDTDPWAEIDRAIWQAECEQHNL